MVNQSVNQSVNRMAKIERSTAETEVMVALDLDGDLSREIDTGIGFLDHLLDNLARHAGFGLVVRTRGDLHVDDHHTVEDTALCLGAAFDEALGDRRGIVRFGTAYAPLDEALARVVVDFSGRPYAQVDLGLSRERIGTVACENIAHFLRSFSTAARLTLHADLLRGENDHHRAEACFKALALALRSAVARTASNEIPSTKGTLVS